MSEEQRAKEFQALADKIQRIFADAGIQAARLSEEAKFLPSEAIPLIAQLLGSTAAMLGVPAGPMESYVERMEDLRGDLIYGFNFTAKATHAEMAEDDDTSGPVH